MLNRALKYALVAVILFTAAQERKAQPGEANASPQQQQAADPLTPSASRTPINDSGEQARETYRKERDAKDDESRALQARQNGIIADASYGMFWLTAINVLIAAVYAWFAYNTLGAVKKQAEYAGQQIGEMKAQKKTLHTQAGAMFTQSRFMKESLSETRSIVIQNESMVRAMNDQLEAMKAQVEVMKENLKETRDLFYMGSRAYLGIVGVELVDFEVGKRPSILIKIINAGNTPAWTLRMQSRVTIGPHVPAYGVMLGDRDNTLEVAPILPSKLDRTITVDTPATQPPLTKEQWHAVKRGESSQGEKFYFWLGGEIRFLDIFGEDQTFEFCLMYHKGGFADCKREHGEAQ